MSINILKMKYCKEYRIMKQYGVFLSEEKHSISLHGTQDPVNYSTNAFQHLNMKIWCCFVLLLPFRRLHLVPECSRLLNRFFCPENHIIFVHFSSHLKRAYNLIFNDSCPYHDTPTSSKKVQPQTRTSGPYKPAFMSSIHTSLQKSVYRYICVQARHFCCFLLMHLLH